MMPRTRKSGIRREDWFITLFIGLGLLVASRIGLARLEWLESASCDEGGRVIRRNPGACDQTGAEIELDRISGFGSVRVKETFA